MMTTAVGRKPLEYYLSLNYAVTLEAAPEGGYFIEIRDLPGCYAQGETVEESMEMIKVARQLWMESMYEDGQDIPEPRSNEEYSGKFIVRTPRTMHRRLDEMAKREGVSLNQYLVSILGQAIGAEEAQRCKPRKRATSRN